MCISVCFMYCYAYTQPVYGVVSNEYIPWRLTSGGGRDLHFLEDKELEVADLVAQQLPKIPPAPAVKCESRYFG